MCMCLCWGEGGRLLVCMCTMYSWVPIKSRRVSDTLALETRIIASCALWILGTKPRTSAQPCMLSVAVPSFQSKLNLFWGTFQCSVFSLMSPWKLWFFFFQNAVKLGGCQLKCAEEHCHWNNVHWHSSQSSTNIKYIYIHTTNKLHFI